jgi:hypothetical protein
MRAEQGAPLPAGAQGWRSDARAAWLRARGWWVVFDASSLQHEATMIFQSSARLTALSLKPAAAGLAGEVEATRQTELTLWLEGNVQEAYLNGVRLPASRLNGQAVALLLLAAGRYHFEVVLHP